MTFQRSLWPELLKFLSIILGLSFPLGSSSQPADPVVFIDGIPRNEIERDATQSNVFLSSPALFSGEILRSINIPHRHDMSGLTTDGTNLWFVREQEGRMYKLDIESGEVSPPVNLQSYGVFDPDCWGIAWDDGILWHTDYKTERLYKLNPDNGEVIESLPIAPKSLGVVRARDKIWIAHGRCPG